MTFSFNIECSTSTEFLIWWCTEGILRRALWRIGGDVAMTNTHLRENGSYCSHSFVAANGIESTDRSFIPSYSQVLVNVSTAVIVN